MKFKVDKIGWNCTKFHVQTNGIASLRWKTGQFAWIKTVESFFDIVVDEKWCVWQNKYKYKYMIHTVMTTAKLLLSTFPFIYILIMFVVVSSISFDDFSLITYQWTFIYKETILIYLELGTPVMSHTFIINNFQ